MKKWLFALILLLSLTALAACGNNEESSSSSEKKEIKIGATTGPYSDMVTKAIKPGLEEKGYKVEVVEFSDYIQPNKSLGNGSIDANLFQHKVYMESFATENKLDLSEVVVVPTAPMGIYSNKYKSLDEIKEGTAIAVPNDPTNMARALKMLEEAKLITLSEEANPLTVSEKDVVENPKKIAFKPIEAAQLPRAVESVDLSAVPGNFALAAKMDLLDALQLEEMPDDYRNRVVVNTKDLDATFTKDLKAVVESDEFEKVIDNEFKGFGKPEWMN
ncbi:MetQ/NlpA family ABC transporter substrate-binding protein [Bacillus sp. CGMCC 1.16541]|uniref:MetQ/NlpA family ABC transporter substrate-binding protein n=1 Tax=Bacillus sp. CGMCC 1.16541 TaxID=2185143 RepID=UPI000D73E5A5|nr:MetQ/NlpA family ABC transporter substrate-binding protein [Bacillus sp. CGMCC 1.16541]